jgi:hypothetical protein
MKRRHHERHGGSAFWTAVLAVLLAAPLGAQVVHTRAASGAAAGSGGGSAGNIAAVAPAPQPVYLAPGNLFVPPGMALYGNLPVVVLTDGRVFADFGRGYEQVIRSCASVVNYSAFPNPVVQPSVVQPTVVQPTITQPLPYNPTLPNQQTASQQMLQQQSNAQLASQSTLVNSQACWTGNGAGLVYVAR